MANRLPYLLILTAVVLAGFVGVATASPPTGAPTLSMTSGPGVVHLSWTSVSGATSYHIYADTASHSSTASYIDFGTTASSPFDISTGAGTTIYARVTAQNVDGQGPASNEASATTPTAPGAPPNVQSFYSNAAVLVQWDAASNGGSAVTNYKIYRGTTSGSETLLTTVGNVLSYTDTGLTNEQAYYYKISAVNGVGEGSLSSETTSTPHAPPATPTGLTATPGNTQVVLTWNSVTLQTGGGYYAYRSTTNGCNAGAGCSTILNSGTLITTTTYTDTGLTNGVTYYYRVIASDSHGNSPQSTQATAVPSASTTVPDAPTSPQSSFGDTLILVTWNAPNNGGAAITNYKIYRGTTSGSETLLTTVGNVLSYTDTGLTNEQAYYYKISAVNSVGEGAQSSETTSTPHAPPATPTNFVATAGNAQVVLTWNSVTLQTGGGYYAQRSTTDGCNAGEGCGYQLNSGALITSPTFTDTGLANGVTYYYRVYASDSHGNSAQSAQASATPTAPATPPPSSPTLYSNTSIYIDNAVGTSFPWVLGIVFMAAGLGALGMVLGRLRSQ